MRLEYSFLLFILLFIVIKISNNSSIKEIVIKDNIKLYDNFITKEEAKQLIDYVENQDCFLQSKVVTKDGNKVNTNDRSSHTCFLQKGHNNIIRKIENNVSKILNIPTSRIEPLQVVRYGKDQEYKLHYDYFTIDKEIGRAGQRIHTFLIYLNDLKAEDGGGTIFPLHELRIKPKCGTALYFRDADDNGNVDPNSLHAGEKVLTNAIKYAINVWVRQYDFI